MHFHKSGPSGSTLYSPVMIVNFLACEMVANLDTSYSKVSLVLLSLSQLWPNVVEQDYTVCMIVEIYRFLALIQESDTYQL